MIAPTKMSTISTDAAVIAIEDVVGSPPLLATSVCMEEQRPLGDIVEVSQGTLPLSVVTAATTMATAEVPEEKAIAKHDLKRLSTALSLASDSEDEPGLMAAEKLSSRNSAPSFEDLKLNTVSGWFTFSSSPKLFLCVCGWI